MTLHVLFTKDGIPGWIGDQPREGSEPVEGLSIEFLAAHRRTAKGDWVKRVIAEPVPPTAEEIAAAAEAEYATALAAEADPQFFRWQRGESEREDWLAAVAAVKARFPKPERP